MFSKLFLTLLPLIPIQEQVHQLIPPSLSVCDEAYLHYIALSAETSQIRLTNREEIDLIQLFLCNISNFEEKSELSLKLFGYFLDSVNFSSFSESEAELLFESLEKIDDQLSPFPKDYKWPETIKSAVRLVATKAFMNFDSMVQKNLVKRGAWGKKCFLKLLEKGVAFQLIAYLDEAGEGSEHITSRVDFEILAAIFPLAHAADKQLILERLLNEYNHSHRARSAFKSLFPTKEELCIKELSLKLTQSNAYQLVDILFAHLDTNQKKECISFVESKGYSYKTPLPGRLGSENTYVIHLGNAEVYFFMDLEKYDLARGIVNDAEDHLIYSIAKAEFPLPTIEVSAIATEYRYPVGYDKDLQPVDIDPLGTKLIDTYSHAVKSNIEKRYDLNIECLSREMNLVISHDAMRFHRDQLPLQYGYLNQAGPTHPKCYLVQDLTLMDWDMPKNGFSGTLMRDGSDGDILFIFLFPGEVTTNFTLDPPEYPEDGSPPVYPGATTLPYHSPFAPIDFSGKFTSGSEKGKRISNVVRGIVLDQDVKTLRQKAIPLPINRAEVTHDELGRRTAIYPNGVQIKPISIETYDGVNPKNLFRVKNEEHIELLSTSMGYTSELRNLASCFSLKLDEYEHKIFRVIKRTGGFTRLKDLLSSELTPDSQVIVINRSSVPTSHEYTHISEDATPQGIPWIQMYFLPPESAMLASRDNLSQFCLTPIEEMFFRNPVYDADALDVELISEDIHSEIDFIILNPKKKG